MLSRSVSWNEAATEYAKMGGVLPRVSSISDADLLTALMVTYQNCKFYSRMMGGEQLEHMVFGDVTFIGVQKKKVCNNQNIISTVHNQVID